MLNPSNPEKNSTAGFGLRLFLHHASDVHQTSYHVSYQYIYIVLYKYIQYIYLDLPRGVEWMIRGPEKHHPLGFKQHPLEDAGT